MTENEENLENEVKLQKEEVEEGEKSALKEEIEEKLTIDEVLNKISYTRYHILMMIIVGLSLASDGVELYLIYLISPVLKEIYSLTDHQISLVVSSLFLGIAIGAISSGFLINQYGRKKIMLSFLTIISIFGTVCILIDNIYWFVFCRFIIGISIGVLFNLTNALCEILPHKHRDFLMGSIYFYLKLGILYFVLIFYFFTLKVEPINNYKLIVICASIPIYLCLILAWFFYDESPRILLWSEDESKVEEGFRVIQRISVGSEYILTEKDKIAIMNDINALKKINLEKGHDKFDFLKILCHLFERKFLKLFLLVIALWVLNITVVFTNLYSLPIILEKQNLHNFDEKEKIELNYINSENAKLPSINTINLSNSTNNSNDTKTSNRKLRKNQLNTIKNNLQNTTSKNTVQTLTNNTVSSSYQQILHAERSKKLKKIIISSLIPIPAEFLAGILTSLPLFGRKYTMTLGFTFQIIFSLMMYLDPGYLYIYSSLIMFFNVLSFNICKLYTTEAFNTHFRDTAYGFSNFCSRIASILTTYIANFAFLFSDYGPCFVLAGVSALGGICSILLPFDTCNKPLDEEHEDDSVIMDKFNKSKEKI